MTFAEVLPALADGRKVRRSFWHPALFIEKTDDPARNELQIKLTDGGTSGLRMSDLLASDWELVTEEPAKCSRCDQPGENHCAEAGQLRIDIAGHRAAIARLEREGKAADAEAERRWCLSPPPQCERWARAAMELACCAAIVLALACWR